MREELTEIDRFLDLIHRIDDRVAQLIAKSGLTEEEKQFILDHIVIVPGARHSNGRM